jgi:hypothetical protein
MKITGTLLRLLFLTCRIDSLALRAREIDDQLEMVRHRTMMDHDSAFRQPAKHPHSAFARLLSSKPHKPAADLASLLGF